MVHKYWFIFLVALILTGCQFTNGIDSRLAKGTSISINQSEEDTKYFMHNGTLYLFDKDADIFTELCDIGKKVSAYKVSGDFVFYCETDENADKAGKIWSYNYKTKEKQFISNDYCKQIVVYNDYLIYYAFRSDDKARIVNYNLKTSKTYDYQSTENNDFEILISSIALYKDQIVFSEGDICSIDFNGSPKKQLLEINSFYSITKFLRVESTLFYTDLNIDKKGAEIGSYNLENRENKIFVSNKNSFLKFWYYNNSIIYIDDNDSLMLVDLSNSNEKEILKKPPNDIQFIANGKLYYLDDSIVKSINLISNEVKSYKL